MSDERAKHLERLSGMRATREFRRSSRILGPICEALEYALGAPATPTDAADADETDSGTEVVPDDEARDCMQSSDPLIARADSVMGTWSVAIEQPAPEPTETRAERLAKREKAVRKRLNSKAGAAEASARVKRVLTNTSGPAMVPGRVSSPTSPEAAAALREVGRDGRPASFAINLYV